MFHASNKIVPLRMMVMGGKNEEDQHDRSLYFGAFFC